MVCHKIGAVAQLDLAAADDFAASLQRILVKLQLFAEFRLLLFDLFRVIVNSFFVWTKGRYQINTFFLYDLGRFPVHQASVLHSVNAKGNQLLHQFVGVHVCSHSLSKLMGGIHNGF